MAEATHSAEGWFGLTKGGKGPMLYAFTATVSTTETIDTGLDYVYGMGLSGIGTAATTYNTAYVNAVSGGTITFRTYAGWTTAAGADKTIYGVVVGVKH